MASAEERGTYKGRIKTRTGGVVRATIIRRNDSGLWKIAGIGGVTVPTSFLPFEFYQLVKSEPYPTLDDAKWAVRST